MRTKFQLTRTEFKLNGKLFADELELTPEAIGFFRRRGRSIELFNRSAELIGLINREGVLCKATKLDDGRTWYSYGDIDGIGEYAATRRNDEVEAARLEVFPNKILTTKVTK